MEAEEAKEDSESPQEVLATVQFEESPRVQPSPLVVNKEIT